MPCRGPEPMKSDSSQPRIRTPSRDILSRSRPNAEGRCDSSATSLTNSMTWIPLSTSVGCSPALEKHVGENFHLLGIPWPAHSSFVFLRFTLEEEAYADHL